MQKRRNDATCLWRPPTPPGSRVKTFTSLAACVETLEEEAKHEADPDDSADVSRRRLHKRPSWAAARGGACSRPAAGRRPLVETHSPVDAILAERGANHVNVNLLRCFYEPATLDSEAQAFLQLGMALAMKWAMVDDNTFTFRHRDLWSRTSARPSTAPLRRSMRDYSR